MRERSRQDLRTVLIAVVAAAVTGLAVPAVSAVVRVTNADKVDGRRSQSDRGPLKPNVPGNSSQRARTASYPTASSQRLRTRTNSTVSIRPTSCAGQVPGAALSMGPVVIRRPPRTHPVESFNSSSRAAER
jgi:hypothetical protein